MRRGSEGSKWVRSDTDLSATYHILKRSNTPPPYRTAAGATSTPWPTGSCLWGVWGLGHIDPPKGRTLSGSICNDEALRSERRFVVRLTLHPGPNRDRTTSSAVSYGTVTAQYSVLSPLVAATTAISVAYSLPMRPNMNRPGYVASPKVRCLIQTGPLPAAYVHPTGRHLRQTKPPTSSCTPPMRALWLTARSPISNAWP